LTTESANGIVELAEVGDMAFFDQQDWDEAAASADRTYKDRMATPREVMGALTDAYEGTGLPGSQIVGAIGDEVFEDPETGEEVVLRASRETLPGDVHVMLPQASDSGSGFDLKRIIEIKGDWMHGSVALLGKDLPPQITPAILAAAVVGAVVYRRKLFKVVGLRKPKQQKQFLFVLGLALVAQGFGLPAKIGLLK